MKIYRYAILLIALIALIAGCSRINNPVYIMEDSSSISISDKGDDLGLLGAYQLVISPDGQNVELTPMRLSAIGESYMVSGLSFFTDTPCPDCLKLRGFAYEPPLIKIIFEISHPFQAGNTSLPPSAKNRLDLDVFDPALVVRPLDTSTTSYSLGEIYLGACGNQDGYTTELADLIGTNTACPYFLVVDNSETGSSTYNEFAMGTPSFLFDTWFANIGSFDLYLTMGYGYSAKKPQRLNPKYYNPEFNRKAAWKVNVLPPDPSDTWSASDTTTPHNVMVEVYDWQIGANVNQSLVNTTDVYAASEVAKVSVEIPGMTAAPVEVLTETSGTGKPNDPLVFTIPIANENGLPAGEYIGLVKVTDTRVPPDPYTDRDFLIHQASESLPVDLTPAELSFRSKDVFVEGNYAYFAGGEDGFMIFDISDILKPKLLMKVADTAWVDKVHVSNGYAYVVSDSFDCIGIFDVTTPESTYAAWYLQDIHSPYSVFESNGYAYIAGSVGLLIYDVDPLSESHLVSTVPGVPSPSDVKVVGNYAYASSGNGLDIVDIQNPQAPFIVKSVSLMGGHGGLDVAGGYAYVAASDNGLAIVDIEPPSAASIVRTVAASNFVKDVRVVGNYAYVAMSETGVAIVDIQTPASASIVGTFDSNNVAENLDVQGDYAFVAGERSGLMVIDINPPDSPSLVSQIGYIGATCDVRVNGDYAYVTTLGNSYFYAGLIILDVSDPSKTHPAKYVPILETNPKDVAVYGDYAYVAAGDFYIIDINPPTSAQIIKTLPTVGKAEDVEYSNGYAYVTDGQCGLKIFDVDPPSTASLVYAMGTGSYANDLCVAGNYAYVAEEAYKLVIFDVHDPASASIAKTLTTPGAAQCVDVAGNYAYVSDHVFMGPKSLHIVNVNPPESAYIVKTIDLPELPSEIKIVGGLAYLSIDESVMIYDINPIASMRVVYSMQNLASSVGAMEFTPGNMFVGCGDEGLRIFTRYIPPEGELVNITIPEYATYQTFAATVVE